MVFWLSTHVLTAAYDSFVNHLFRVVVLVACCYVYGLLVISFLARCLLMFVVRSFFVI